jgi:hypothetical protein
MNSKKLYKVKFKYFSFQLEHNFKKPACMSKEYGEFFFNWSIETAKQFARHLLSMQPSKFFVSSTSEIEAVTMKKEIFQQIIDNYNKTENKKIDKFELISIIPFIVESNFEIAINTSLTFFCLENSNKDIITRNELGLFIDSYFRSLHNIVLLDDVDQLYAKTQNNVLRLSDNEIEDLLTKVFEATEEELPLEETVKRMSKVKIWGLMKNVNTALYSSLKYYEGVIKGVIK